MLRLARVWVVCVLALALLVLTAAAEPKELRRDTNALPWHSPHALLVHNPFVSFFSACEAELRQFCAHEREKPLKCLVQHFAEAQRHRSGARGYRFGEDCSHWLLARDKCVRGVRKARVCKAKETASECLRRVPPRFLPHRCRDTSYYRSVMLYGKLNKRREDGAHNYAQQ